MNFTEALKAMKEGKSVRRDKWYMNLYFRLSGPNLTVKDCSGEWAVFSLEDFEANDWEIFEVK